MASATEAWTDWVMSARRVLRMSSRSQRRSTRTSWATGVPRVGPGEPVPVEGVPASAAAAAPPARGEPAVALPAWRH
eukprot:4481727-Pyramimonas_sp.AAC.1